MMKVLGGVVVGVFIGAIAVEIINRKMPGLIRHIEDKAEETATAIFSSFKQGYHKQDAEEPPKA